MNPEVFDNCSTILLDIAGTIGSINFVEHTLFAFAKKNVAEFLTSKWEEEETKKLVAQLKADGDEDIAGVTKAVERFNALTDEKTLNAGVKTLQGLLYKQGYETGELKAHVFDDIKSSLEGWSKHRKICVFSSGSEEAQKQYFTHSTAGDLSAFISKYFDLSVGKKTDASSYETIAKALEVKTQEMLFISDDVEEIKAASTAGCTTVLVTREGNAEISADDKADRIMVSSFAELPLSAKRKLEASSEVQDPPAKMAKVDIAEKKEPAMEVDSTDEAKLEKMDNNDAPTDEGEVASSTTSTDNIEPAKPCSMEAEASTEKSADTPKVSDTAEAESKVETTTPTDEDVATKSKEDTTAAEAQPGEKNETTSEATSSGESQKEESKPVEEQNGNATGEETTNGVAVEEKENKSEVANGMADSTPDEVPAVAADVPVKKLDDANETTPLPVEA